MITMCEDLAALTRLQRAMPRLRSMSCVSRVAHRLLRMLLSRLSLWTLMDNPIMVPLKTLLLLTRLLQTFPALSLPTDKAKTHTPHHHKTLIPVKTSLRCLLQMYIRRRTRTRAALLAMAMKEGTLRPGIQGRAMKLIRSTLLLRQVWPILLQPQRRA
jgi:hypothetical protein